MLWGVDASNVNGQLDFGSLAAVRNPSFVFFKATEGTGFRDPLFPAAWAAIRDLGFARGAYHFAHPAHDPRQQADVFLGYVRAAGLADADSLWLDLEDADGLPPDAVSAWGREFCAVVTTQAQRPCGVYTFLDFAWAGNCAGLGRYPLWIADPSSPPGQPRVPAPWTRWAVHQYGQQGLDLDVANYPDTAAMTAALGVPGTPGPAPQPGTWQEVMMRQLPVVRRGDTGPDVRTVQALCVARGHEIAVDGDFGHDTCDAVAAIQRAHGLTADCVVGPVTWPVLLGT